MLDLLDQPLLAEVRPGRVRGQLALPREELRALGGQLVLLGRGGEHRVLLVDDQQRALAEVVEQRRLAGERAVAGGRGQLAAAQRRQLPGDLLDAAARPLRDAIEAAREFEQRVVVREPLAGRADHRLVEALDRALRLRVEAADRLHLVAEQLDAQRQRGGRREDVEDAAAPRRLARPLDERSERVAGLDEPERQRVEGDPPAGRDAAGPGAEIGAARRRAGGGGDGGDDERRPRITLSQREPCEDGEAALRDRGRRRLTGVGQARSRREEQRVVTDPHAERLGVALGVALSRDQQQRRATETVL